MTKAPDQYDLFARIPAPDYELADPSLLAPPACPRSEGGSDGAFAASVRSFGILTPILVTAEEDGGRTIVSGVRRAAAAASAGQFVPVRVLSGSKTEALCAAFSADTHVQRLSTVERGWRFAAIVASAESAGIRVTVRWVIEQLGVSQGTAHGLLSVARRLPPERVQALAAKTGVTRTRVQSLPFHAAVRLSQLGDEEAVVMLRQRFSPAPQPALGPKSWWTRVWVWLRWVSRWFLGDAPKAGPDV